MLQPVVERRSPVQDLVVGVAVDVEDDLLSVVQVDGDEGRRGQVLEGGDLDVGVLVLNLRQVPEHKLRGTLVMIVTER